MSFRILQYLVALEEIGHFNEAAERCQATQSTLSLQVKRLEDYLGVELFDRKAHPVLPTPVGAEIVALARIALQVGHEMKRAAARYRQTNGVPHVHNSDDRSSV